MLLLNSSPSYMVSRSAGAYCTQTAEHAVFNFGKLKAIN